LPSVWVWQYQCALCDAGRMPHARPHDAGCGVRDARAPGPRQPLELAACLHGPCTGGGRSIPAGPVAGTDAVASKQPGAAPASLSGLPLSWLHRGWRHHQSRSEPATGAPCAHQLGEHFGSRGAA
jgi:hypothetical protein